MVRPFGNDLSLPCFSLFICDHLPNLRFTTFNVQGGHSLFSMHIGRVRSMEASWQSTFKELFETAVERYQSGQRSPQTMFEAVDVAFLSTIGCTPQELFDFVDDSIRYDDLDYDTTLQVAAIRERYLREVMKGVKSDRIIPASELPPKPEPMDGIPWLPRIIAKARAKLRGELDEDTMYGCAGDRPFLASWNLTLPEFLEIVWKAGDNDQVILQALREAGGK